MWEQFQAWVADKQQEASLALGLGAKPDVYLSLDPNMLRVPQTVHEAYAQAIYFLGIAAQRAHTEGLATARDRLARVRAELQLEAEALHGEGWLCTLGISCSARGATSVLTTAIDTIRGSGLGASDVTQATRWLVSSRRALRLNALKPLGVGATTLLLGAFALDTWRSSR